MLESNTNIKK